MDEIESEEAARRKRIHATTVVDGPVIAASDSIGKMTTAAKTTPMHLTMMTWPRTTTTTMII